MQIVLSAGFANDKYTDLRTVILWKLEPFWTLKEAQVYYNVPTANDAVNSLIHS